MSRSLGFSNSYALGCTDVARRLGIRTISDLPITPICATDSRKSSRSGGATAGVRSSGRTGWRSPTLGYGRSTTTWPRGPKQGNLDETSELYTTVGSSPNYGLVVRYRIGTAASFLRTTPARSPRRPARPLAAEAAASVFSAPAAC